MAQAITLLTFALLPEAVISQIRILKKEGLRTSIDGLDIAPGGNYFLGWGYPNTCVIWDMRTGQEIQKLAGIQAAKFASNGEHLYVFDEKGHTRLIDLTGKTLRQISQAPVTAPSYERKQFYPEESMVIIGKRLYLLETGTSVTLDYEGDFSRHSYNPAKKLHVIPLPEKKQLNLVPFGPGSPRKLATSIRPNQVRLSLSGDLAMLRSSDTLQVINISDGAVRFQRTKFGLGTFLFDKPGEHVIGFYHVDNGYEFASYHIASGKLVWKRHFLFEGGEKVTKNFIAFTLSPDGKSLLAANGSERLYEVFDVQTGATVKDLSFSKANYPLSLGKIAGNRLPIYFQKHQVILNLETGTIGEKMPYNDKLRRYSGDVVAGFEKTFDGRYEVSVKEIEDDAGVRCRNNGGLNQVLTVRSLQNGKVTFTRSCKWHSYSAANNAHILALQELPANNFVNFYDYRSGKKLFSIPYKGRMKGGSRPMHFSPDDKYLIAEYDGGTTIFDLVKKTSYQSEVRGNYEATVAGFTPDSRYAVFRFTGKLRFVNLANGKLEDQHTVHQIDPQSGENTVSFTPDARFMFHLVHGSGISVFDRQQNREVATVYAFMDSATNDWAVVSRSGLFEANQGAQHNVYYTTPSTIAPLSTLFEKYFTPRLLPRILAGENFQVPDINTLAEIPRVKIGYAEGNRNLVVENEIEQLVRTSKSTGTVTITAECPGDKVTEIRLYQNGKLAGSTRNLLVEDDPGVKSMVRTFNVTLSEGNNVFTAIAVNSQRSESKPAMLNARLTPQHTGVTIPVNAGVPRLHLVVIGINAYKNPKYNLNYAQADATAFKAALEAGARDIFRTINTYFIADHLATKDGIQNALDQVKQNAGPDDLLVFYYAGHGVLDDKKEFYLVPHDVTQLYGNDHQLSNRAVSTAVIQQYSKDIRAQKQLFILDACQSAGAFGNMVALRGAAEEKAIAQLARSTGTHWLTASGSDQFAAEFSQLGHGSFTWCLLQALKGEADNGDKKLTVKEIDSYLQIKVPEVTEKYKGNPQYPASFGYGNDFPVVIIK